MSRWRAYRTIFWAIVFGLGVATFTALVAIVAFTIFSRQQRVVVVWQQPPFSATPAASPVSAEGLPSEALAKEGWQTYRNEELGFEFQYPNYWVFREAFEHPSVSVRSGFETPSEESLSIDPLSGRTSSSLLGRVEDVVISGKRALKSQKQTGESPNMRWISREVVIPDTNFYIALYRTAPKNQSINETFRVLETILSTFRFIPVTTARSFEKWRLYQDNHFEFQHPINAELVRHDNDVRFSQLVALGVSVEWYIFDFPATKAPDAIFGLPQKLSHWLNGITPRATFGSRKKINNCDTRVIKLENLIPEIQKSNFYIVEDRNGSAIFGSTISGGGYKDDLERADETIQKIVDSFQCEEIKF